MEELGEFQIIELIGSGAFGEIFSAKSKGDGTMVAIKKEPKDCQKKTLDIDARVLQKVQGSEYFPKFYKYEANPEFRWMAMELMGPSIANIIEKLPERRLTPKCALTVSKYLLRAVEALHEKGFIHRDLKPDNILTRSSKQNPIALTDFGLSKVYFDERTKMHLPAKPHSGFPGTFLYASPNAHMRRDLSRRDDIFSWFYVMIDLVTGNLPWKNMTSSQEILNQKAKIDLTQYTEQISTIQQIYSTFMNNSYVMKPDYNGLFNLVEEAASKYEGSEFDW